ncbi:MarR family winged helix-turn-helix transcriptional regulator [Exiguobacterium flavidum]|uniref:MarR family winged helix-turn-helix transcriptional regulator n=1 Tax=Exiguobacterium flavidum TaxID=2184695 RepID=UPI001E489FB8|nr:MarR family winged helix-turn-helix transcriptional regulator [Exiguobacterium flavidum]
MGIEQHEQIELELAILIRRLGSMTSEHAMDRSAYLLLRQLSAVKTAGVKSLAEALQLDVSTVSRQATALSRKGWITKLADPLDRRAFSYELTTAGQEMLCDYRQKRTDSIGRLLEGWTEKDQELFSRLLHQFNHSVREDSKKST